MQEGRFKKYSGQQNPILSKFLLLDLHSHVSFSCDSFLVLQCSSCLVFLFCFLLLSRLVPLSEVPPYLELKEEFGKTKALLLSQYNLSPVSGVLAGLRPKQIIGVFHLPWRSKLPTGNDITPGLHSWKFGLSCPTGAHHYLRTLLGFAGTLLIDTTMVMFSITQHPVVAQSFGCC